MNNIFLLDPDTMNCTWENNLELDPELIIGSFECKFGFRDKITIATTRVITERLYNPGESKWISNKFLKSQKMYKKNEAKISSKNSSRNDKNRFK